MKRIIIIIELVTIIFSRIYAIDYVAITEVMYDTPLNEVAAYYPHNIGEYIELYNDFIDSSSKLLFENELAKEKGMPGTETVKSDVILEPETSVITEEKLFPDEDVNEMNPDIIQPDIPEPGILELSYKGNLDILYCKGSTIDLNVSITSSQFPPRKTFIIHFLHPNILHQ